jgi:hypothetical protein
MGCRWGGIFIYVLVLLGNNPAKPKHMSDSVRAARAETGFPGMPRRMQSPTGCRGATLVIVAANGASEKAGEDKVSGILL